MGVDTRYRIGDRIGGGGMAEVLRAELVGAEGFSRPVAIKRILPTLSENPAFGKMFVNEARIASLLSHPNVVSVLDFDRDAEGRYFLVMELVDGIDLRQLANSGRLPIAVALHIVAEICRGLAYAHERVHEGKHLAIVHRDMSPHNVMLSWSGAVKVVDFGIAKIMAATDASRSGSLKGKIAYMSPEQAHGHELDGRSDVFAVGVMLHELLTGQRLFSGASEPEILARLLAQPIARPRELVSDVPKDLDSLVMDLLEREPERRVASAREAAEALISCSAASTRAPLALRSLLRERFADKAPLSADVSGPVRADAISQPLTQLSSGQTETASVLAMPPSAPLPAPASAPIPPGRTTKRNPWPKVVAALSVVLGLTIGIGLVRKGDSGPTNQLAANIPNQAPSDAAESPAEPESRSTDAGAKKDPGQSTDAGAKKDPEQSTDAGAKKDPGQSTDAGAKPEPAASRRNRAPGFLTITVSPWAKVSIPGKRRLETPVLKLPLAPGSYRIRLRNDEASKNERVPVQIRSGKTTVVRRNWND